MKEKEFEIEEVLENAPKGQEEDAVEKQERTVVEYIAADSYPPSKFKGDLIKESFKLGKKVYYPIVGWNPDLTIAAGESKIPPMRKWLNKLPKKVIHSSGENKSYVLYG